MSSLAPLFIFFLLILAGVWVAVNRQGLLDMYHQQIHGEGNENTCPKAFENEKRPDRSINPFKTFLSWPKKEEAVKYASAGGDQVISEQETPKNHLDVQKFEAKDQKEPLVEEKKDEVIERNKEYESNPSVQTAGDNQAIGLIRKIQAARQSEVPKAPIFDFKREFASDEANPYIENLRQRYEPSPYFYGD